MTIFCTIQWSDPTNLLGIGAVRSLHFKKPNVIFDADPTVQKMLS